MDKMNAINEAGLYRLKSNSTATASSGAATLNRLSGKVTSESLTTAAAAEYTLTLTNSMVEASDIVLWSVGNGTNSGGTPGCGGATPAAGSVVFTVTNLHASSAFNGTIVVSYELVKTQ